jgi:hypothetical protein
VNEHFSLKDCFSDSGIGYNISFNNNQKLLNADLICGINGKGWSIVPLFMSGILTDQR